MKSETRKKNRPTNMSFGLLELAARSAGFSLLSLMDRDHAERAELWLETQPEHVQQGQITPKKTARAKKK